MDSTATSMEYSDSISMEAMAWHVMASIECHGRGGILQNSTEAMELDLVENLFKLLRKWPLKPSF